MEIVIRVVDGQVKVNSNLEQKAMLALLLDVVKTTILQPAAPTGVQIPPAGIQKQLVNGFRA
jgi:hypothetical protein